MNTLEKRGLGVHVVLIIELPEQGVQLPCPLLGLAWSQLRALVAQHFAHVLDVLLAEHDSPVRLYLLDAVQLRALPVYPYRLLPCDTR